MQQTWNILFRIFTPSPPISSSFILSWIQWTHMHPYPSDGSVLNAELRHAFPWEWHANHTTHVAKSLTVYYYLPYFFLSFLQAVYYYRPYILLSSLRLLFPFHLCFGSGNVLSFQFKTDALLVASMPLSRIVTCNYCLVYLSVFFKPVSFVLKIFCKCFEYEVCENRDVRTKCNAWPCLRCCEAAGNRRASYLK